MSEKKFTRNKEEKIEKIFQTFFDLVLKEGYHKTSTNKVAEVSGLSIGTVYRYFPEGKQDIIKKYFENSVETTVEINEFKKFDITNISHFFKGFISKMLRNHKANKGYYLAFREAILSDENLSKAQKKRVFDISKDLVNKLRESNDFFKSRNEERLINSFVLIYNLLNAIIYHHLLLMELFDNDERLIDYLSNLIAFTINYLQKI